MGNIRANSPKVTLGDPKEFSNRQSNNETNTPLNPKSSTSSNHFTADPQGRQNQDLKTK